MNYIRAFSLLASLLFVSASVSRAETPTITISKSDKIAVAIGAVSGADGGQVAKILQNDLAMSGFFNLVPAASAQFTASGTSGQQPVRERHRSRGKTVLIQDLQRQRPLQGARLCR